VSATTVTDTDRGAKAMVSRLRALAQSTRKVRVGVLSDAPKKSAESGGSAYSLLEVAIAHEFGAPASGLPQRSFIRATVDERRADIERLQLTLAKRVALGQITEEQALNALGAKVAAWCQARIVAGIAPPLAASTLARKKGKATPLILTGQLRSSITYALEG